MKKICLLFALMMLCIQSQEQVASTFKALRYDEDYTYLKGDSSTNWYKHSKYLMLTKASPFYLSIGGDVRYQYFYSKNDKWGEAPKDSNGYILTRYLLHADFHGGKFFRTFIQLQSSLANSTEEKPSPVQENQLDLHQVFIDITLPSTKQVVMLRIGRQEMLYGSQRLVSVREGPNNRQSFDAARLVYSRTNFKTDLFYSHYVRSKQQIFDDRFNKGTRFWGSYFVINKIPVLQNVDAYYLGLWKSSASFDDGKARELRHSVGTRIWNKARNWQYDFEGLYQWGAFGDGNISAWTLSSNTTYTISSLKLQPQFNLKTELITGDRQPHDGKLNTFNPLFPRGGYFGLAALIGPSNLMDIHPGFAISPLQHVELSFDYDAFWRYSKHDGIYGPSVAMIYPAKNTSEKRIGQQLSMDLVYTPNSFLYFRGEFTWFNSDKYLKAVGPGKDILFGGITTQLKF